MTNLFLISTPLQLLNAIEAKRYFNIPNHQSSVIFLTYTSNYNSIVKILVPNEWGNIHFVNEAESQTSHEENIKGGKIMPILKELRRKSHRIKELVDQYAKVNFVFVGYYLGLEQIHFVNSIAAKEIILLDDGIATLEVNNRRVGQISFLNSWSFSFFVKALVKKFIFGYRLRHPQSVSFFSIYEIEVLKRDFLIKHKYEGIRSLIKDRETCDEVYFLGQPLSEIEPIIVTEGDYFLYLNAVVSFFKDKRIVYVPHRDEDKDKVTRIRFELDLLVEELEVPFEWFMINKEKRPKAIAGFITSALPNCKELFGADLSIYSFRIEGESIINDAMRMLVSDTYSYFEKIADAQFKVIDKILES
ncbi:MAG: polysialyltransferase family glycosyltransferase [Cyclobacteriaceae bacterium]|jgi:hypothetical protein